MNLLNLLIGRTIVCEFLGGEKPDNNYLSSSLGLKLFLFFGLYLWSAFLKLNDLLFYRADRLGNIFEKQSSLFINFTKIKIFNLKNINK